MNKELQEMIKLNKYPKECFTKAQRANMRCIDLIDFTQWFNPDLLIKIRGNTRLAANHSVVINGIWARDFENSTSYTAIDYCINYLDLSAYGAMYVLNEYLKSNHTHAESVPHLTPIEVIEKRIADGRYIQADKVKEIYAYLRKTRCIPYETIKKFRLADCLYAEKLGKGYNLLFPIYKEERIIGFEANGILSDSTYRYKGCIISEQYTGFTYQYRYIPNAEEITYIFESGIDLMSFATLADEEKIISLPKDKSILLLSLRGLQNKVLEKYVKTDSNIVLCIDNDKAGQAFYDLIKDKYSKITCYNLILNKYSVKDWNDLLKMNDKITNFK